MWRWAGLGSGGVGERAGRRRARRRRRPRRRWGHVSVGRHALGKRPRLGARWRTVSACQHLDASVSARLTRAPQAQSHPQCPLRTRPHNSQSRHVRNPRVAVDAGSGLRVLISYMSDQHNTNNIPSSEAPTASGDAGAGPVDQIVVLTTAERPLSTPAAEYEVTAKYHVPEVRLLTV